MADNVNKTASEQDNNTGKVVGSAVGAVIGGAIGYILLGAGAILFGAVVCGLAGGALGAVFD